jgi:hypothetical protein
MTLQQPVKWTTGVRPRVTVDSKRPELPSMVVAEGAVPRRPKILNTIELFSELRVVGARNDLLQKLLSSSLEQSMNTV